jgi:acyl-coenzyme A synthetase/AMP-(fatty) acid ligase
MILQRIGNRGIGLGRLLERAAAKHPTNIVILDHDLDIAPEVGRRVTVPELADLADDVASRLWAAGVRPGDRVVVYKSDGFDITLLALATARIGAVPTLLSPKLDGETVAALVRRAERPHLVTDGAKISRELPKGVFDETATVLLTSGNHRGAVTLRGLAGSPRVAPVDNPPDHPALITHTSGTTGIPKLAVHTGRTLQARYRPQYAVTRPILRRRDHRHPRLVRPLATVHRARHLAVPRVSDRGHGRLRSGQGR